MSISEKRGDAAWEDCVAFVSSYCPHHSNRESRTGSDVAITRISCPIYHRAIKVPRAKKCSFRLRGSPFHMIYRSNRHPSRAEAACRTCKKYISWKKYLPSLCPLFSSGRIRSRNLRSDSMYSAKTPLRMVLSPSELANRFRAKWPVSSAMIY